MAIKLLCPFNPNEDSKIMVLVQLIWWISRHLWLYTTQHNTYIHTYIYVYSQCSKFDASKLRRRPLFPDISLSFSLPFSTAIYLNYSADHISFSTNKPKNTFVFSKMLSSFCMEIRYIQPIFSHHIYLTTVP